MASVGSAVAAHCGDAPASPPWPPPKIPCRRTPLRFRTGSKQGGRLADFSRALRRELQVEPFRGRYLRITPPNVRQEWAWIRQFCRCEVCAISELFRYQMPMTLPARNPSLDPDGSAYCKLLGLIPGAGRFEAIGNVWSEIATLRSMNSSVSTVVAIKNSDQGESEATAGNEPAHGNPIRVSRCRDQGIDISGFHFKTGGPGTEG